jgi:hypothetical protein
MVPSIVDGSLTTNDCSIGTTVRCALYDDSICTMVRSVRQCAWYDGSLTTTDCSIGTTVLSERWFARYDILLGTTVIVNCVTHRQTRLPWAIASPIGNRVSYQSHQSSSIASIEVAGIGSSVRPFALYDRSLCTTVRSVRPFALYDRSLGMTVRPVRRFARYDGSLGMMVPYSSISAMAPLL